MLATGSGHVVYAGDGQEKSSLSSSTGVVYRVADASRVCLLDAVHFAPLTTAHVSRMEDGTLYVVTGGMDERVVLWDGETGQSLVGMPVQTGPITAVALYTLGSGLFIAVADDGRPPNMMVLAVRRRERKNALKWRCYSRRTYLLDVAMTSLVVSPHADTIHALLRDSRTFHTLTSLISLRDRAYSASSPTTILDVLWGDVRSASRFRSQRRNQVTPATSPSHASSTRDGRSSRRRLSSSGSGTRNHHESTESSSGLQPGQRAGARVYLLTKQGNSSKSIVVLRVHPSLDNLCSDAVVVVTVGSDVYVWIGPDTSRLLHARGIGLARELLGSVDHTGRRKPLVLQHGSVDPQVHSLFQTDVPELAPLWAILTPPSSRDGGIPLVQAKAKASSPLPALDHEWVQATILSTHQLLEVYQNENDESLAIRSLSSGPIRRSTLQSDAAYLIATTTAMWVWIGSEAPERIRSQILASTRATRSLSGLPTSSPSPSSPSNYAGGDSGGDDVESARALAWDDVVFAYEGAEPSLLRLGFQREKLELGSGASRSPMVGDAVVGGESGSSGSGGGGGEGPSSMKAPVDLSHVVLHQLGDEVFERERFVRPTVPGSDDREGGVVEHMSMILLKSEKEMIAWDDMGPVFFSSHAMIVSAVLSVPTKVSRLRTGERQRGRVGYVFVWVGRDAPVSISVSITLSSWFLEVIELMPFKPTVTMVLEGKEPAHFRVAVPNMIVYAGKIGVADVYPERMLFRLDPLWRVLRGCPITPRMVFDTSAVYVCEASSLLHVWVGDDVVDSVMEVATELVATFATALSSHRDQDVHPHIVEDVGDVQTLLAELGVGDVVETKVWGGVDPGTVLWVVMDAPGPPANPGLAIRPFLSIRTAESSLQANVLANLPLTAVLLVIEDARVGLWSRREVGSRLALAVPSVVSRFRPPTPSRNVDVDGGVDVFRIGDDDWLAQGVDIRSCT